MRPILSILAFFCTVALVGATGPESLSPYYETATRTIQGIINDIASWQKTHKKSLRPFVTVTYAQSLDGKIALLLDAESMDSQQPTTSSNFALSDPESLRMTHALRSIHEAILVGGRTLSVDNPRLNNRLWRPEDNDQPRPIILDTHLKHIKTLGNDCRARNLLVCCSEEAAAKEAVADDNLPELLPCPVNSKTGRIELDYLLKELKAKYHIESVMVEGGASVLSAFYSRPDLVDCLCITSAPQLLLWNGLPAICSSDIWTSDKQSPSNNFILDTASFDSCKFRLLGKDSIFLAKLK